MFQCDLLAESGIPELPNGENHVVLRSFVPKWYRLVTTDGRRLVALCMIVLR